MSTIELRGDLVYGEFKETYDFSRTMEYIDQSANLCHLKKCTKALMDIRGVAGKISMWDRFKLAQATLQKYGRELHLAVIYRDEEMNGFFEDVVVNRGGNFHIVSSLDAACKWLGIEESAVVVK